MVGIKDCMASRGNIADRGARKTGTRMHLVYLMVILDVEVGIYFALFVVWRALDGPIEYDSI